MALERLRLSGWPGNVWAGYTQRCGGYSTAPWDGLNLADHVGDDPASVEANRQWLRQELPRDTELAWLRQVHGTAAVQLPASRVPLEADASWTSAARLACVVLIADCLPMLLCSETGSTVAAVHVGWRGLEAGIIEATVGALPEPARQLLAWLGPCIGPCHFQIGGEVREALLKAAPADEDVFRAAVDGSYYADLATLASRRLERLGVSRIVAHGACTVCEEDRFFSFRRDGQTGRLAALILRN